MILIVRDLSRDSKDKLFNLLDSIAKNQVKLKNVTWGDSHTLVLELELVEEEESGEE